MGQALGSPHGNVSPTAINEHNIFLGILVGDRIDKYQVTGVVVRHFCFLFF